METKESETVLNQDYNFKLVPWKTYSLLILHLMAVYGYYLMITEALIQTMIFWQLLAPISAIGILVGAHRYWSHRTFKAKLPLKLILMFLQTLAMQGHVFQWSRDHRTHHKFSDTDADPHNSNRGFFFSHMGWLMVTRHPALIEKGKTVDVRDLEADPLIRFQRKYYFLLIAIISAGIPTLIPYYFWNENIWTAFFICFGLRWAWLAHITFCVNSVAHMWGYQPYDNSIKPVECAMRLFMMGEGYHNYHHAFPWDYSASELGPTDIYNPATTFINIFARIGWAYDLKKAPKQMIESKVKRSGSQNISRNRNRFQILLGYLLLTLVYWPVIAYRLFKNVQVQ